MILKSLLILVVNTFIVCMLAGSCCNMEGTHVTETIYRNDTMRIDRTYKCVWIAERDDTVRFKKSSNRDTPIKLYTYPGGGIGISPISPTGVPGF